MTAAIPAQPVSPSVARARQNIFPGIRYQDAPAAIAWLETAFGFEQVVVYTGPDGNIAHAELSFQGGIIMLGAERPDGYPVRSPRSVNAATQGIYVCVENVDALWERAVAAGAEVVRPPANTDYGSREFGVRDPEGHLWDFGTYDPFASH
jgi:uncharacterized glyoxalase superfamily protein PhnB